MAQISDIELVNTALVDLDTPAIMSFTENSKAAKYAKLKLPSCIRELLSATAWSCARETVKLVLSSESPTGTLYTYKYLLPNDPERIKTLKVHTEGETYNPTDKNFSKDNYSDSLRYEIKGNFLNSNTEDLYMTYIKYIDVYDMAPYMLKALEKLLASELADPLTGSTTKADYLRQNYERKLAAAVWQNALEDEPVEVDGDVLGGR